MASQEKELQRESEQNEASIDRASQVYPSGYKLAIILISLYIGMFLVALVCERIAACLQ